LGAEPPVLERFYANTEEDSDAKCFKAILMKEQESALTFSVWCRSIPQGATSALYTLCVPLNGEFIPKKNN
jgi:hypothetical protein